MCPEWLQELDLDLQKVMNEPGIVTTSTGPLREPGDDYYLNRNAERTLDDYYLNKNAERILGQLSQQGR